MQEDNSTSVPQRHVWVYCPLCGEELEKKEHSVSPYRKNIEVICPNHGTLT
jgi:uncharacterized Zn finger protein (UPF0148 family)